jgi:hypothetical protein
MINYTINHILLKWNGHHISQICLFKMCWFKIKKKYLNIKKNMQTRMAMVFIKVYFTSILCILVDIVFKNRKCDFSVWRWQMFLSLDKRLQILSQRLYFVHFVINSVWSKFKWPHHNCYSFLKTNIKGR